MQDKTLELLLDKGLSALGSLVGVAVGAWLANRAASRADARRAERDQEVIARTNQRRLLEERLARQREVYAEYYALGAKWSSPGPVRGMNSTASRADGHSDATAIYPRIAFAFGSQDFAEQAAMAIVLLEASARSRSIEQETMRSSLTYYLGEMQQCILAMEQAIELPRPRVPVPQLPPADFDELISRARFSDLMKDNTAITDAQKLDLQKKLEEALAVRRTRIEQRATAGAPSSGRPGEPSGRA
jgi:hypothetical protein